MDSYEFLPLKLSSTSSCASTVINYKVAVKEAILLLEHPIEYIHYWYTYAEFFAAADYADDMNLRNITHSSVVRSNGYINGMRIT